MEGETVRIRKRMVMLVATIRIGALAAVGVAVAASAGGESLSRERGRFPWTGIGIGMVMTIQKIVRIAIASQPLKGRYPLSSWQMGKIRRRHMVLATGERAMKLKARVRARGTSVRGATILTTPARVAPGVVTPRGARVRSCVRP